MADARQKLCLLRETDEEALHAVEAKLYGGFHLGLALDAGWTAVREPKDYPRYSHRYYASFVEDADGIRLEFMYNPPKDA